MSSRLNVELHPLQNVKILSTVFQFCDVSDLKHCRIVGSKLWLEASMKAWREKAVLNIRPEADRKTCRYNGVNGISFRDLQAIYDDENDSLKLHKKPFKNVKLEGFSHKHFQHSELSWILDTFSDHIRHLSFKSYEFASITSILETVFLRLPNLVELKLEKGITIKKSLFEEHQDLGTRQYSSHQKLKCLTVETEMCTTFSFCFSLLLRNIANLQDLCVFPNKWAWYTEHGKNVMLAVALVKRDNPTSFQLKHLDNIHCLLTSNGFTGPDYFQMEATYPLERFTGRVVDVLYLKPYSGTLEYLDIIFNEKEKNAKAKEELSTNERISLPHVKEFHARGSAFQVFHNLNKVEALNLKTLVIGHDFQSHDIPRSCQVANIDLRNSSFRNVTKLECYSMSRVYVVDLEDITLLSESMPNVLHATTPLTRKAFEKLCSAWVNLLTLTISECDSRYKLVDDEAITGIKPDVELPLVGERPANITNLKKLTDFVHFTPLTDHSVNFGFLQLPRLHYLNVRFIEISEEADSELRKKVNTVHIQWWNKEAVLTGMYDRN